MWNRKELKTNAKGALKRNYWKAVVASIVLGIVAGVFSSNASNASDAVQEAQVEQIFSSMGPEVLLVAIGMILAACLVSGIISILISAFVTNPLGVGAQKLLINCKDDSAQMDNLLFGFKNSYLNVVKIMFLKGLFTSLWSLLLIVPGIVKAYEYRMIPYLLADNPDMDRKEAFARSKEMMMGNKWNAFVLDLSFIGWHLLGGITLGIVEIFYVLPYNYLTDAELYHALKK